MNFSLIIPVFNNSESIDELFIKIKSVFDNFNANQKHKLEIIFVDDFSKDSSIKKIETLLHDDFIKIKLISLKINHGQRLATLIGLKKATFDKLIVMSADLQDDPEYLLNFFKKFISGSQLIVGMRSETNENILKRFTSWIHYKLIRIEIKKYPLNGTDFYGFDRKIFEEYIAIDNYFLNLADLFKVSESYDFFYYKKKKRKHGKSQYNFLTRLDLSLDQIICACRWPLRLLMFMGSLLAFFSLLSILVLIFIYFYYGTPITGWRSAISTMLFFFGILLFSISLLSEYIYRILIILRKPNIESIKDIKDI
jgi:glycosyltransferase involved in cell wall biosynthesis